MHIDAVIAQIGNYSTSISKPVSVIEFGSSSNPSAPYVVVRQEGGVFRVNTHFLPGQESALRLYVRKDLQNALYAKTLDDSGSKFRLFCQPDDLPGLIINSNDDGTISQERLFRKAEIIL